MSVFLKRNLLFALPILVGISTATAQEKAKEEPGINISYMDKSSKASNDFFRYVNGAWLDKTEIPADRTRWGSFDELRQRTDEDALAILKEAASNHAYSATTDQGKAVIVFESVMDVAKRNKLGISPLKPYFKKIDAVRNAKDLQALLIEMEPIGGVGFLGVYVGPDAKDSNTNVLYVGPGSLGLPDRDYYMSDDADSKEKRAKYETHVARMLAFVGDNPATAKKNAERILAIETAMSSPRLDRVERRDRRKSYNPMTVADLQKLTPAISWNTYLNGVGVAKVDTLIVSQPKYMTAFQDIVSKGDVAAWKAYMKWTLLNSSASILSTEIEDANFDFYGKTLTGAMQQRPREERALQVVNGTVGEALGKLYVEKKFPAEAKVKAEKMIKNVFKAFENRINNLTWMSPETRVSAIEKLHKSRVKIGYPDKWKDYSKLVLLSTEKDGNYFDNMKRYSKWRYEENIADLQKPVDKDR